MKKKAPAPIPTRASTPIAIPAAAPPETPPPPPPPLDASVWVGVAIMVVSTVKIGKKGIYGQR
jgi:hypothetical protein